MRTAAASALLLHILATGVSAAAKPKPASAPAASPVAAPELAAAPAAPPAAPAADVIAPARPVPTEFPVIGFTEAGVDPPAFMRAITPLYDGSMIEIHAILVLVRGALVYEDYFIGNTDKIDFDSGLVRVPGEPRQWLPDDLHHVASVSKTVSSLIAGIAMQELGWSLDEPLAKRLGEASWILAGDKSGITARNLLTMTSGMQWSEWSGRSQTDMWASRERFRRLASTPMEARPGEIWTYNSSAPNILMLALDRALEGGVRSFADARFFRPLGIDDYRWGDFEDDLPDSGVRLAMRPRDMAKIGLLILNEGVWNGVQVVPRDYIIAATSPQVSTAPATDHRYGFLTWIRGLSLEEGDPVQYIAIEGDGGNNISVFPDRQLVVVTTSGNYGEFPVYEAQGQRLLRRIVPLFSPIQESP